MPTNRLRSIKFLKTAFLNILKCAIKRACLYVCYHGYTIPNKPTTFKFLQKFIWQDKSSETISVSERIVAFCNFSSLMPSPDETYGGVEIYSCSFFSGGVRNTFEYSYMKCLYNKPNFTSKHGLKCIRTASTDILNLKVFSGEIPRTPPYERGVIPRLVLSPISGLRPSRNAYAVRVHDISSKVISSVRLLVAYDFWSM